MMRNADRAFTNEMENEYRYESIFDSEKLNRDSKTIFIAIPCYRDSELTKTINSALLNAKNPERLVFGVGLIYKDGDEKYWEEFLDNKQVKMSVKEATAENVGLGNQRADANSFYNKEDYFLQIDAHMRFDMHWDDLLIHQLENLKALGEEKPLITGYPRSYAPDEFASVKGHYPYYNPMSKEVYYRQRRGHNNVPCMRVEIKPAVFFKNYGFPRHGDRIFTIFETIAFSTAVSPAQIFADGRYVTDVPADRAIRFLEEEQYYAIFSYMKGYNFYTPRVTGIIHYYADAYGQPLIERHHPIEDFPDAFSEESYLDKNYGGRAIFDRLKKMKKTPRSFSDYEKFAGVDYEKRRLIAPVNKIVHNKITEAINFASEIYSYSTNDYIDWMYDEQYHWYEDVKRNETPQE